MEIFSVPIGDKVLMYAPLHGLAALVNEGAAGQVRAALEPGAAPPAQAVRSIIDRLRQPGAPAPQARSGPLEEPLFLGLIPTRGCNLGCRYCNFPASKQDSPVMEPSMARAAVDAYFDILRQAGKQSGEIHFFGGEPFFAEVVVHFSVGYALLRAEQLGLKVRFEATTNGFTSERGCRWIADHFDSIVLSLDGTPEIQDRQRPAVNGRGSAQVAVRNARILSDGPVELILRACITQETVSQMEAMAAWFASELKPSTVCFEGMTASPLSQATGLLPPDPFEFAIHFLRAARVLEAHGIEPVNSTGGLHELRASCCPVGKDALIVSPDGTVDACYLLPEEWQRKGMEMRLGRLYRGGSRAETSSFRIDPQALKRARSLTVDAKPRCANCLCRYHCAGGCHVNRCSDGSPGDYDAVCLRTRLITIARLLERLDRRAEADAWLADRGELERAAWQRNDRLLCQGDIQRVQASRVGEGLR